jgi:hypothetical protein
VIIPVPDSSASAARHALGLSNCVLFFSLPFKPAGRRNLFLNGHIALGMEGTVYQAYDPKLLKADFLFSRMPWREWLLGKGGAWVDRDPSSPRFTHVYLYGECESKKTVVYYAGIEVESSTLKQIKARISEEERRFRRGDLTFNILGSNCSSMIAAALGSVGLVAAGALNRVPVRLFKDFVRKNARESDVRVGKVAAYDESRFELHRYCVGTGILHPEKAIDRWVAKTAELPAPLCGRRSFYPPHAATMETER